MVSNATTSRAAPRVPWARAVRARLTPESPLGMASVGIVLALVLGTSLVEFGFTPFTLRLSVIFWGAPPSTAFADTGTIVFTPVYGNDCRRILFSNRAAGSDRTSMCPAIPAWRRGRTTPARPSG
jgi:hypothetical protein